MESNAFCYLTLLCKLQCLKLAKSFFFRVLDKILSQVFPLTDAITAFIRRGCAASEASATGGEAKPDSTEAMSSLLLGALGGCRYLLPHLSELGDDLVR